MMEERVPHLTFCFPLVALFRLWLSVSRGQGNKLGQTTRLCIVMVVGTSFVDVGQGHSGDVAAATGVVVASTIGYRGWVCVRQSRLHWEQT